MFYSFKDCEIKIDDRVIPVNSANLSLSNQFSPLITQQDTTITEYAPERATQGSLRLSYYLTGADYIKSLFFEQTGISGNIAGFYFDSGYLKSYSFEGEANAPVVVSAEFLFYEQLKGEMQMSRRTYDVKPLNYSDALFLTTYPVTQANFSYTANFQPTYFHRDVDNSDMALPEYITWDLPEVNLTVSHLGFTPELPTAGYNSTNYLVFRDASGNTQESYTVRGRATQKTLAANGTNPITSELNIRQQNTYYEPEISGFSPTSAYPGDIVAVSGANLKYMVFWYINDKWVTSASSQGRGVVTIKVPQDATSGKIKVITAGGVAESSGILTVLDLGITIL